MGMEASLEIGKEGALAKFLAFPMTLPSGSLSLCTVSGALLCWLGPPATLWHFGYFSECPCLWKKTRATLGPGPLIQPAPWIPRLSRSIQSPKATCGQACLFLPPLCSSWWSTHWPVSVLGAGNTASPRDRQGPCLERCLLRCTEREVGLCFSEREDAGSWQGASSHTLQRAAPFGSAGLRWAVKVSADKSPKVGLEAQSPIQTWDEKRPVTKAALRVQLPAPSAAPVHCPLVGEREEAREPRRRIQVDYSDTKFSRPDATGRRVEGARAPGAPWRLYRPRPRSADRGGRWCY
ncbi:uncharacterized protein LOC119472776 [Cebus imitator]|uniref:uncharacterized protein LOC119472776 n=1 Tax=Cebus imitator TaxID=2715852 RepID=UPI001897D3D2|nr:uncharacterized protein LOC119472776 [Cebus imitator]